MKNLIALALVVLPVLYLISSPSFEAVGAVVIGSALALAIGSTSTVA